MIIHKIYDTLYPRIRNSDLLVKSVEFGIYFFWGGGVAGRELISFMGGIKLVHFKLNLHPPFSQMEHRKGFYPL